MTAPSDDRRPHALDLEFAYARPGAARLVARAVEPEVGEIGSDRTVADVARTDATVRVSLRATDLVALRAGLNTWTSLVEVAERVAGVE